MKITEKPLSVQKNVSSRQCGIELNRFSFDILARLYSDSILAILRELGTNAYEGHVRAGKSEVPFLVKLPNTLDPYFRVRDFGCSMPPETIYNVYLNYLASDKRQTNDEGGFFGLGSKTPFTYCDNFSVVTYIDGVKRTYVMALGESGCPELNEFPETETNELNGTEISFIVKSEDFSAFADKVRQAYRFFQVKPEIVGIDALEFEPCYYFSGDSWGVSGGDSYAVMANVGYKIDKWQFSSDYRNLLGLGVHLYFDIGELKPTPSRESLEYTDDVKKHIVERLDEVKSALIPSYKGRIDQAGSFWKACLIYKDLKSELGSLFDTFGFRELKYNGKDLQGQIKCPCRKIEYDSYKNVCKRPTNATLIPITSSEVFFVDDTKGGAKRVSQYIKRESRKTLYILTQEAVDILIFDYGFSAKVIKVSTLPKVVRKSTGGAKIYLPVLIYDPSGSQDSNQRYYDARYWIEEQINIKDGVYYYVGFDRYETFTKNGRSINVKELCWLFDISVYAVRRAQLDRFSKYRNWIPVEQYLTHQNQVDWPQYEQYRKFQRTHLNHLEFVKKLKKSTNEYIQKYLSSIPVFDQKEMDKAEFLAPYHNINVKIEPDDNLIALDNQFLRRFPMLQFVAKCDLYGKKLQTILDYVNSKG